MVGGPWHLLGVESLPPLRHPQILTLAHPGTSPGANLQPHPPTTITTVAFKTPLVKRGSHPLVGTAQSLSALSMQGCTAFPRTRLQLLRQRYPTDHPSSIQGTGARPPAAPAQAHTDTVQRNGLLRSLREQSWEASGRVSRGAAGVGTSVHGLQQLALGPRRLSMGHPRSHCTPSSSTYVEGNQPTCRGSREVSWRLGS